MKKIIFGSLFLSLLGICTFSCKKEKKIASQVISNDSKSGNGAYYSDGKMLIFSSTLDYERLVSNPTDEESANLISNIKAMNHQSYNELLASRNETDEQMDEFFGHLINKDKIVQIGDYIYRINIVTEKVYVLHKDENSETNYSNLVNEVQNSKIRRFSTNDDVIALAEGNDEGEKACPGIGGGSYPCYANNYEGLLVTTLANGTVWRLNPGVKFFRAGVWFRLSSLYEIWAFANASATGNGTKVNNLNGLFTVKIYCKWPQGWYQKRPCNSGSIGTQAGGLYYTKTTSSHQQTFYSGTRNLNGYHFFVQAVVQYPDGTNSPSTPYGGRNINSPY
jgi:hypothetical protein